MVLSKPTVHSTDKNLAVPGITKVVELFSNVQKKGEQDILTMFLYVMDREGKSLCYLSTTFFARIHSHSKNSMRGFSLLLNEAILGDFYELFKKSKVATIFTKEKGIVDTPGHPEKKCEFFIKDFGYDAIEASAVIGMLLDEVFNCKPSEVTFQIQLFGYDSEGKEVESIVEFDSDGEMIAKSGWAFFSQ